MNIFQTQMDLSNEVKQLSPVKLPRYDVEGEKIHICKIFDFESMIDDYMVELEIRNYSQNTIKTYHSIQYQPSLIQEDFQSFMEILTKYTRHKGQIHSSLRTFLSSGTQ